MNKAIYIHGLGGSGNGSSARNIKKILETDYEFFAGTYDLLNPSEAFSQIQNDAVDASFVVASSLGAFYAASLVTDTPILLLNPCLDPENAIPKILYPEQRKNFDEEKCIKEWREIKKEWNKLDREDLGTRFAVFSDRDELFSFIDVYRKNFGIHFGADNFCMISGTHEIAKDETQLAHALLEYKEYRVKSGKLMSAQSDFCFGGW